MFNKKIFSILTALGLFVLNLITLSGCAERIVNENANNVTISMSTKASGLEMSSLAQYFWLSVEAEDIPVPIVSQLTLDGAVLNGEVIVPVGTNRHFIIYAYDALLAGNLIYQGDTYADVTSDSTITVYIDLFPVVPLMKVIPRINSDRISSVAMGESFEVDIYVYNIPEVRYISFDLGFLTNNNLLNLFDVLPGADLPADSRLSWEGGSTMVAVWLDRPNLGGPLVDALGNAHLLTFYFSSHSDTMDDLDTASLEINPIILDRGVGDVTDPFPLGDLYLESAIVELYQISGT